MSAHGTDAPPNEFSAEEWEHRAPELRHRRAFHDRSCRGCTVHGEACPELSCPWRCRVFQCRAERADHCCGRYVGSCVGGSDDNRCADCWCRLQKAVKRRIVTYVGKAPGGRRREDAICRKFGVNFYDGAEPPDEDSLVADLLYQLVREGKLSWDHPENDERDGPLWYRLPLAGKGRAR